MFHVEIIKDGDVTKVKKEILVDGQMYVDETPREGSANLVTSDGVNKAIGDTKESVDEDVQDLQEQIDDIAEKAGSGYTPKGEADVATLNALTGQENGWLYTMTDSGTLTDGSLAVVAGDTVAWDATNEVWYKAMDYAPRQYGTNEVHNIATAITAFRTGDVIPVDGPDGTAKMPAENLATKENVIASQSHVVDLNDASYWQNGGLNSSNGKEFDAVDRLRTIFLKLTENGTMSYTSQTGVSFTWTFFCYNANKEFLGYASNFSIADLIVTYPTAVWFRLTLNSITGITPDASHIEDVASFGGSLREYDVVRESQLKQVYTELETLDEKIDHVFDDGKTALNMNDTAFWQNGGIDSSHGTETGAADRLRTIFLRLTSDSNISYFKKSGVNFSRSLYCYDENKVYLGYSGSTSIATALESFPTAVWFRIGLTGITGATVDYTNIANIFNWQSGLYEVIDGYATRLGNLEKLAGGFIYQDPLKGKKWYACGDSFTAGVTGGTITADGPYKGYPCAYPYFVGNRTGMDVHDIAVSGSTMTYKSGTSTASNCFSYPSTGKYLAIPADADYITLKFGINDDPSHQDMPLGTINDNTNETLYGAWNVVISYLVANCPHAKIGIIVSNGCYDPNYSKAARDIAEKWGLGYLDENFDYKVPLLIRVTGKPNVSSAAHNAVLAKMRVSESNTHPNDWAHEYESKIVEAWLRTL